MTKRQTIKKAAERPQTKHLVRPKKGERFGGRAKGSVNQTTRVVKDAIILAAELSKHSKGKGLVGYITHLADNRPDLYVSLMGRLIPLQVKGQFETSVEHTIKAKPERQMTPQELADYYAKLRSRPQSATPLVIEHDKDEHYSEAAE